MILAKLIEHLFRDKLKGSVAKMGRTCKVEAASHEIGDPALLEHTKLRKALAIMKRKPSTNLQDLSLKMVWLELYPIIPNKR